MTRNAIGDLAHGAHPTRDALGIRRPRVLLVIEMSRIYGRRCLQGIASYAKTHGPWTFVHLEREPLERLPATLKSLDVDGVIARVENKEMARVLASLKVPVVDLFGKLGMKGAVVVTTSSPKIVEVAVEHCASRGYRHLAYCGLRGLRFSEDRQNFFEQEVKRRKLGCHIYNDGPEYTEGDTVTRERLGESEILAISKWISGLPKPLAVMACNDTRGRQVVDACQIVGVQVPEQVGVVGVDNDDVICDLCQPSLSSVDPHAFRVGFEGAGLLHRAMRGDKLSDEPLRLPPLDVVTRRSSDTIAIDDPTTAKALHIIRERACDGMTVESLLDHLAISRATLERRFLEYLNRTPKAEITRIRVERAKQLLMDTDFPTAVIADKCGYRTSSHLSVAFKAVVGVPPSDFRDHHLAGKSPKREAPGGPSKAANATSKSVGPVRTSGFPRQGA